MNVSAVIPTRGDVDLSEILDAMPREWQKVIWDNSQREDLAVYGRYAAIDECEHDVVFVQDDDCVLAPEAFDMLLAAYQPGHVAANMPDRFRHDFYSDHCLVGFGAIFDRGLPRKAFELLLHRGPWLFKTDGLAGGGIEKIASNNPEFSRTCDVVFTTLTPRILVDAPYRDLPWASEPTRMWKQPDHVGERLRMLELVRRVRDGLS